MKLISAVTLMRHGKIANVSLCDTEQRNTIFSGVNSPLVVNFIFQGGKFTEP